MHELTCPACGSPSQQNIRDHILMCPFCSASFRFDLETGRKETFGDHFIIPNTLDPARVKEQVLEWLKRLHHKPGVADKEFVVLDIRGASVPFWIVSLEVHTVWKGQVQRQKKTTDSRLGSDFLTESGNFRRTYRWAVNARSNVCENWGLARLHEPKEAIDVVWDGFPLDSTYSRGRITPETQGEKTAYDRREFFEFKYSNGLPILGCQIGEEEALRRAKNHVERYHYDIALMHTDYLLDCRHELDIAGVQLIHLPFWEAIYAYRPTSFLRHFHRPVEKHVLVEGINGGILKGELGIIHRDKVQINSLVTGAAAVLFFLMGALWSPIFFLVSLFFGAVSGMSAYIAMVKLEERKNLNKHIMKDQASASLKAKESYS